MEEFCLHNAKIRDSMATSDQYGHLWSVRSLVVSMVTSGQYGH